MGWIRINPDLERKSRRFPLHRADGAADGPAARWKPGRRSAYGVGDAVRRGAAGVGAELPLEPSAVESPFSRPKT